MEYRKKLVITTLLLCAVLFAKADISDTLIHIDKVVIKGLKFSEHAIGSKIYSIDTLTLKMFAAESLADILNMENSTAVKSYGPEGMASVSVRGGSSRHTAVIWNGFNLTNPMSGGMNYSALPAGFIDEITIQPGGSSTMYGSGSACGIILLSNNLTLNNSGLSLELNSEAGSFKAFNNMISLGYSGKNISSRIKAGYQVAENDFKFHNPEKYGEPLDTLKHAGFRRYSLLYQLALKTGKHSKVETDFWYMNHFKKIPSLLSDYDEGKAEQTDENISLTLNYSTFGNNWFIKYRSGLLFDNILYNDPAEIEIHSKNSCLTFINEIESHYTFGKHHAVSLGINHTQENAVSESYTSNTERIRTSIFGRYNLSMFNKRMLVSVESREEYVDDEFAPFVFSIGSEVTILPGIQVKGVTAKHYALPVFDDLFWIEDAYSKGNPELTPEYGWNNEAGIVQLLDKKNFKLYHEVTVFRNNVNNLIIWLPSDDGKWTPENVNKSLSRGFEFLGNLKKEYSYSAISIRYMYSYTKALIWEYGQADDAGSRRIYVPEHAASLSVGYLIRNFEIRYLQTFTSKRYYDNFHALDSYTLGNIFLNYTWMCNNTCFSTYLKILNIYNTAYQTIAGYAQAPRSISAGINLSFK